MRNAHHNILEPKAMSSNCNQQSKDPKTSFTILNNKLNFCLNHYLNNSSIIDIGDSFSVDRLITVAWQADNNHFCFFYNRGGKKHCNFLDPTWRLQIAFCPTNSPNVFSFLSYETKKSNKSSCFRSWNHNKQLLIHRNCCQFMFW